MITMQDWMEAVNYRISEGSDFGWRCFGENAYTLDSWDGDQDGVSSSIVFDTNDQTVYQVSVYDYSKNRAYRIINPEFKSKHDREARNLNVSIDKAWDDINYIDLETDSDMLEKLEAIMNYEEYDDRVSIPLELPNDEMLQYMVMAHERDMTFNQFVSEAIKEAIKDYERDPEGMKQKAKVWKDDSYE